LEDIKEHAITLQALRIYHENEEIEENAKHVTRVGWKKWRND